jgi:hypothetical protein
MGSKIEKKGDKKPKNKGEDGIKGSSKKWGHLKNSFTFHTDTKTLTKITVSESVHSPMKTYFIKIALHSVSPMVWRRLKIPGNTSLAELHYIMQVAFNWDDDYLHQFHIYGKDYGIAYDGGLSFADDAHAILLDNFEFDAGDKFTYEYNFFDHWLVDIRIERIEVSATAASIICLKGSGMHGVDRYDEIEPLHNLLKAVLDADESTTLDDIRPYIDALNAVKFNRALINHRLQTESIK